MPSKEIISFEDEVVGVIGAKRAAGKMLKKIKAPGALPKEEEPEKAIGKYFIKYISYKSFCF